MNRSSIFRGDTIRGYGLAEKQGKVLKRIPDEQNIQICINCTEKECKKGYCDKLKKKKGE